MDIELLWQKKETKIALIALGIVLVAWLGMATWLSKIHIAQKNIEQFWGILENSCQRRVVLLPKLGQLIFDAKVPEAATVIQPLKQVFEQNKQVPLSIQILNDPAALEAFWAIQNEVVSVFLMMDKKAPTLAGLATNQDYFKIFKELEMIDAQITFSVHALNRQIAIYNRIVGSAPQKWLNQVYPRYPLKYPIKVPTMQTATSLR